MPSRGKLVALALLGAIALFAVSPAGAGKKEKPKEVWTDPADATLPEDFKYQGEYVAEGKTGVQVIALGHGAFQAVVLPGGLPGAGWNFKDKSLLEGKLSQDMAEFSTAQGKRQYLAQDPLKFSAVAKFPAAGQKDLQAKIVGDTLTLKELGEEQSLKKIVRKSPTLGTPPPAGAIVLFDGKNADEWQGGRLDADHGILNTDGHDLRTKRKFNNYTVHLEFMEPYRPNARGQGRGNSGFYQVDLYEVQILDSFGLDGLNNECGGIYSQIKPSLNMCLPPLQWQTYDIEFTNAQRDDNGKATKKAHITARLNGVIIHEDVAIAPTPGGRPTSQEGTPGSLMLQGHGNPLQFRNIWIVETK